MPVLNKDKTKVSMLYNIEPEVIWVACWLLTVWFSSGSFTSGSEGWDQNPPWQFGQGENMKLLVFMHRQ